MKRVRFLGLSLLLAAAMFMGCSKDDAAENQSITVSDKGALTQNVFADEERGKSGVTFTTTGAWMSSISEATAKKAAAPAWISIDPDHGDKAGNYTISISLEPNYTGKDRTATIHIACGDTEITASVTQKSVKEDGKTPVAVTGVTIDKSELSLYTGDKAMLEATIEPADTEDKTLVWSSSNTAVATVSETGEVTAVAEGEAIIAVATRDGGKTASCTVVVKRMPSVDELAGLCNQSHDQLCEAWLQIDNGYSTLTSRQSVTHTSQFLSDFWEKSYECISYGNLLIDQLESSNLPESEKAAFRARAFAFRATAYFYLKTLFGGVPLTSSPKTSANSIPRNTAQEVVDFIYDDIDRAEVLSAQPFTAIYGLIREIIYMQENDGFSHVINVLREKIDSGELAFRDINGDGQINAQDGNTETVLVYLLLSEACLKTGNTMEAAQYINRINEAYGQAPALLPSASANDIQTAIRQKYSGLTDTSMKFLNTVRWGDTQSWGYRTLLPIPSQAMQENPNLTQNSGW